MKKYFFFFVIFLVTKFLLLCESSKDCFYFETQEQAIEYMNNNGYGDTLNLFSEISNEAIKLFLSRIDRNGLPKKSGFYVELYDEYLFNCYYLTYVRFRNNEIVNSWRSTYWTKDDKRTFDVDYDEDFNIFINNWFYFESTDEGIDYFLEKENITNPIITYEEDEEDVLLDYLEEYVEDTLEWPFRTGCYIKVNDKSVDGYLGFAFEVVETILRIKESELKKKNVILYAITEAE